MQILYTSADLLQGFDAVPVGACYIVPVNEVQGSVVLRLEVVNVMCLGVCSVGKDTHTASDQQV